MMAVWSEVNFSDISNSYGRLDSEYYRPEYLESEQVLSNFEIYKLKEIAKKIDVGFVGTMKRYYCENGVPLIQTQNIKEYFLNMNDFIQITPEFHAKLLKSQIHKGDLLIARSGSYGKTSIYLENEIVNSSDIIIIKIDENIINPFYVLAFLNSKNGSAQLIRFSSGGLQGHVNLTILEDFKVPKINIEFQNNIASIVLKSYELIKLSQSLYTQAQEMLERELGLDKLVFDRLLSYEARLSEVVGNNRADADYYQVKYRQLDKILSVHSIKKIRYLSEPIETGIYSSNYSDSGRYYIRGTDIKNGYIGMDLLYRTNILIPKYKTVVIENDILVTRVGSIGVCGIVEHELSGSFFSDNLIRIRLLKSVASEISPSYLNLLLNTTVGQMQMMRYSRGSVQQRLNQSQLAEIPVPIIRKDIQDELGKILLNHRIAKKESQQLLEQAKRRVEELIEQAVKK